jgi:plasmid maintenance system antidote protein VapI
MPANDLEMVLRKAIVASGLTHYELGKRAQVHTSQLDRFVSEKRSLNLPAASRLADTLGLELRPIRKQINK